KALALACITFHRNDPKGTCKGGNVVGTIKAKHWLRKNLISADLDTLTLGESPALDIYYGSLVNLGCFISDDEMAVSEGDPEAPLTFDEIELSPLGMELARAYDAVVGSLSLVRQMAAGDHRCSVRVLREFGKHGGLCELSVSGAADCTRLRDMFFSIADLQGKSHRFRRQSLLMILELCRQFSADEWVFNEPDFAGAVYFGELAVEDARLEINVP